jgi:two-component sensor histidine kinase
VTYSFAAHVRAQLPCIRHRFSEERRQAETPLQPLTLTLMHYEALSAALDAASYDSWLAEVRILGASVADRRRNVETLITEAVSFSRRLRECVVEDMPGGMPDDPQLARDLDQLETSLISALLAGYTAARERDLAEQKEKLDIANALHDVNSAANSTLDLDTVLDKTVQAVVEVSGADTCSIFIYEAETDRLVLRATRGLSAKAVGKVQLRRGQGVTGLAAEQGKPVAVRAARTDPRYVTLPLLGEEAYHSILAVPIVLFTAERKLVGVITVESREERDFGQREINFLETVAGEIAIAIENARLYQQTDSRLRQKVDELETLQGFSATVAETLDLRKVMNLLASQATYLVEADAAVIYERRHDHIEPMAVHNFILAHPSDSASPADGKAPALNVHDSVLGRAVLTGVPIGLRLADPPNGTWVSDQPGIGQEAVGTDPAMIGLAYQSVFCVPLSAPRGIVGAICLYCNAARTFNPEQIALLSAFAREGAIAVENARLYEAALHGLEVKTWLLREMNHRVRNNLARAVSLLQMQRRRLTDDSAAARALADSILRMESIARVHDLLSREELGITSVADLVQLASEVVTNTLSRPDLRIQWQLHADPIAITSPTAFPLLLALVEVLSNALLHGFAGREEGTIEITATIVGGAVHLTIRDNGVGLPPGFDPKVSADLGLMIVQLLIQSELKGTVRLEPAPGGGTQVLITFTPPPTEPA